MSQAFFNMPELPEVETIRRGLEPRAKGRVIQRVELRLKKQARGLPASKFERLLVGKRIVALRRRAKFLLFDLSEGWTLLGHLGMSGQISYWDHKKQENPGFDISPHTGLQRALGQHPIDKHTHIVLHLEHGDRIQYRDIRQFGYMRLVRTVDVAALPSISRLGLEPVGARPADLVKALADKRGMIKALLLNQSAIVGLGNIYCDEALFAAQVHPRQRLQRLTASGKLALAKGIIKVLTKALKNGGTSLSDYRDAEGRQGRNQESLTAYGRAGLPCLRCASILKKIQVSQRTTVHCPHCQKLR